jgi:hypothetical protein
MAPMDCFTKAFVRVFETPLFEPPLPRNAKKHGKKTRGKKRNCFFWERCANARPSLFSPFFCPLGLFQLRSSISNALRTNSNANRKSAA